MSDPITWYALPRTVVDVQSILEAVDAKMLSHNLDPSAHGQSGEAVHDHRSDEDFDHPQYTIYNIKTAPAVRMFKAIVGPAGVGDFVNLQEAIDYVNLYCGGTVMVLAGTYTQTGNVDLYDNINLVGQDRTDSIIDFNETSGSLRTIGTVGTRKKDVHIKNLTIKNSWDYIEGAVYFYYADNCSVVDCNFTGNWDSGNTRGREIKANEARFLEVKGNYFNLTAGEVYILGTSTGSKVKFNHWGTIYDTALNQYASNVDVLNNEIMNCEADYVMYCENDNYCSYIGNVFNGGNVAAVRLHGSQYARFIGNHLVSYGPADYCLHTGGECSYNTITGNTFECECDISVFVDNTDYCTFTGNVTQGEGVDGIKINDAGCTKNVVVGNYFEGGITDNGTNTVVASNATGA